MACCFQDFLSRFLPALAALARRFSQFFENRAWHKGCMASGVVKNENQRPAFRSRAFTSNQAGSCAGGPVRFPDVVLYQLGFTASLNQWRSIRTGWTDVANLRGRRRVVLWQGASRQENGEGRDFSHVQADRRAPFAAVWLTSQSHQ